MIFCTTFSAKTFLVPLTSHHSTPFKLSFLVTHWLPCLFLQLLTLSVCMCKNQKMLFVWGRWRFLMSLMSNKRRAESSSRKGHFPHTKPGLKFCDYLALHHKELLSLSLPKPTYSSGSELAQKSFLSRQCAVNASHFIEFFASLILLLRCTSLL